MDMIYSEAFDHMRPSSDGYSQCDEVDRDPKFSISRNLAVKKRSGHFVEPPKQPDIDDDMGQAGSSEYTDVFDVSPNIDQSHAIFRQTQNNWQQVQHDIGGDAEYCFAADVEDIHRPPPARVQQSSVSYTDDYSQPHDRLSISSKGDYTEPYEDHLNKGQSRAVQYTLAKDINQLKVGEQPSSTANDDLSGNQYDSTVDASNTKGDGENYDHIKDWQSKDLIRNINMHQAAEVGALKSAEKCWPNSNNYEEPWDSTRGQEKLSMLLENAEKTDIRRVSVDKSGVVTVKDTSVSNQTSTNGFKGRRPPKPRRIPSEGQVYEAAWEGSASGRPNVASASGSKGQKPPIAPMAPARMSKQVRSDYEEAWDTPEKQLQFEERLEQARQHRASQEPIGRHNQDHAAVDVPRSPSQIVPSPLTSPIRRKMCAVPELSPGLWKPPTGPVSRSDSCASLGALAEKVNTGLPMKQQPFFHGKIKRSEAERLLLVYKEGSYLIRQSESSRKDFSLTLKGWNGQPMHMKICSQSDGTYILGENSPPFATIPEMVHYYTNHELPVQDAARICLLYPIPS